jgi:KUP system potassium uptake protein
VHETNIRHNHVLHARTVIVSVATSDTPRVPPDQRLAVTAIAEGVLQVEVTFGYIDEPDVVAELRQVQLDDEPLDVDTATFFIGRETVTSIPEGEMARWREHLFIVLNRGAASASRFYHLPSSQVFEVGTQVEI